MDNPWGKLPHAEPFVLEDDMQSILEFNKSTNRDYHIHLELLPEPYLGNPNAKIVLLNLNPGYSKSDIIYHRGNESFIKLCRNNLLHNNDCEYPFYLLDPRISKSPGSEWWRQRLKPLIDIYEQKKVANEICCIEFFPYHSKKYRQINASVPSQMYSFHLVKEAIRRGAIIIIMRSIKNWLEHIPELKIYKYYTLNSTQNVTISRNNLQDGFPELIKLLGKRG